MFAILVARQLIEPLRSIARLLCLRWQVTEYYRWRYFSSNSFSASQRGSNPNPGVSGSVTQP
jgi:hypothetical protein